MKKVLRVLIGGILITCGCGFFFYPNFREWNTQREVEQIINSFDKTYNEGLTNSSSTVKNKENDVPTTEERESITEKDKAQYANKTTATPAAVLTSENSDSENGKTNGGKYKSTSNKGKPYQSLYNKMVSYNEDLSKNGQDIYDAWSYEQQPFDLTGLDIDSDTPVIGYIEIPDMKIRLPLLLGASSQNLEDGAAVLSGTSMPIGGDSTNCVIAGHRGWEGSAYFQYIENMKIGSKVYVTNPWETLVYECTNTKVIDPNDISSIKIQSGKDMITLLTCHPYVLGGGPYRYIVFCERVDTQTRRETNGTLNPKAESPSDSNEVIANSKDDDDDNSVESNTSDVQNQSEREDSVTIPVDIKNTNGIDLLALEQTLRYMLPAFIVLTSILIIMLRSPKKTRKMRKKKNKNSSKKKNRNKRRKRHEK